MSRTRKDRVLGVYARTRKDGTVVYYGDFRRLNGKCERLIDPDTGKTIDNLARALVVYEQDRIRYVEGAAAQSQPGNETLDGRLGSMITYHLDKKKEGRKVTDSTLEADQRILTAIYERWGNIRLKDINTLLLDGYVTQRLTEPGVREGSTISLGTVRNELNALSNMLRRAVSLRLLDSNPVADMHERPTRIDEEAHYLEIAASARLLDAAAEIDAEIRVGNEAQRLLNAARAFGDGRSSRKARELRKERKGLLLSAGLAVIHKLREPIHEPLSALFLYTGARHEEILGLQVEDIDFANEKVHIEPNRWRTLKRRWHSRSVTLWPPLARTLRAYLAETGLTSGLLFPTRDRDGNVTMRHSVSTQMARVVERAQLDGDDEVTPHTFRHTYTAMMLQTYIVLPDGTRIVRGAIDVKTSLGHRSTRLVDLVYSHVMKAPRYMDSLSYEEDRRLPAARLNPGTPWWPPLPGRV